MAKDKWANRKHIYICVCVCVYEYNRQKYEVYPYYILIGNPKLGESSLWVLVHTTGLRMLELAQDKMHLLMKYPYHI